MRAKANNCACLQLAQYLAALAALHVLDYGEVQRHLDSETGQRLLVLGREYHTSTQTCIMWKFRRYWCSCMPHTAPMMLCAVKHGGCMPGQVLYMSDSAQRLHLPVGRPQLQPRMPAPALCVLWYVADALIPHPALFPGTSQA